MLNARGVPIHGEAAVMGCFRSSHDRLLITCMIERPIQDILSLSGGDLAERGPAAGRNQEEEAPAFGPDVLDHLMNVGQIVQRLACDERVDLKGNPRSDDLAAGAKRACERTGDAADAV